MMSSSFPPYFAQTQDYLENINKIFQDNPENHELAGFEEEDSTCTTDSSMNSDASDSSENADELSRTRSHSSPRKANYSSIYFRHFSDQKILPQVEESSEKPAIFSVNNSNRTDLDPEELTFKGKVSSSNHFAPAMQNKREICPLTESDKIILSRQYLESQKTLGILINTSFTLHREIEQVRATLIHIENTLKINVKA